jgi:outer membrane receptor for ferric coprogen and ferric-rhodotorulic acid
VRSLDIHDERLFARNGRAFTDGWRGAVHMMYKAARASRGCRRKKREYKEVDMNTKKSAAYFHKIKKIGERCRE